MLKLALLGLFATALALPHQAEDLQNWRDYKSVHNKFYYHDEDARRFEIFRQNLAFIAKHNLEADLGMHSFRLGATQFADMTNEEFRQHNGYRSNHKESSADYLYDRRADDIPAAVDWRDKGLVTYVKNQGQCGSCWAFSAVASLEGQTAKKSGKLVALSEQNLVDCAWNEGNQGCGGGLMDRAFQYVKDAGGLDTEDSYPYRAQNQNCVFNKTSVAATLTGFVDLPSGDEAALANALANIGPISVAIDASSSWFQHYTGGVYDHPDCANTADRLDHGVTAVGYGTDGGKDYWLIKNSWGGSWGEQGYIRIVRNLNNQCGVATEASYPLV
ncbi:Procathepsin L [Halotydeus destructor]|nr:Procathepsin L [Halotydeus destructor]